MRYLNKEDLISVIQERLLDESVMNQANDETTLNDIESKAIDFAISYISGRYDTNRIFTTSPLRNGVLVQAIAQIVVYRAVRRNAARKVPGDFRDLYDEAVAMLKNIQKGSTQLKGLPTTTEIGTGANGSNQKLLYGNNTDKDNFI